jgi:hypothetical protein
LSLKFGLVDRAMGYLTSWIARHPDDASMKEALDKMTASADSAVDSAFQSP